MVVFIDAVSKDACGGNPEILEHDSREEKVMKSFAALVFLFFTPHAFATVAGSYTCDGTHGIQSLYLAPGHKPSVYVNGAPAPRIRGHNYWQKWYLMVGPTPYENSVILVNGMASILCTRN